MAQLNDSIVRGILEGSGVTRWEVEQLCHRWLQTSTTTPQPGAEGLRTVIASMSNFADVADQCELTEHNAQVAIRSWVTQLESLLSRGG